MENKEVYDKSRFQTVDFDEKYSKYLAHLDSLLWVLHEGVCISNADGIIVKMNPMYARLSQLPPEALIGKKVKDLNNGNDIFTKAFDDFEQCEDKYGIYHGPVSPLVLKRKKPANAIQTTNEGNSNLLHGYPVYDESGEVVLVVTFIRNINQLSQYKEEEMAYHSWLSHSFMNHSVVNVSSYADFDYIFQSESMKALIKTVKKISSTDAPVLILGETGSGKDVIARLVHSLSNRAENVFFKADCTSIPENLVESELFGYAKGAFSGAEKNGKLGYFEAASQGTIFLDEVGEFPLLMQSRFLRVLQDKEILKVGALIPTKVDTRVIAATNVDLEQAVEEGTFRRDLFYRLNVCVLRVPPLKERKEDILPLTKAFLNRYNQKYKKHIELSKEAEEMLLMYSWPGNIRELKNLIQGLVISCENIKIAPHDFPSYMQLKKNNEPSLEISLLGKNYQEGSLKEIIANVERELLQKALDEHGSLSKVAKIYKLDRTTVARKLNKTVE